MGMFDSVYFKCPSCGETIEEQSKVGDCMLFTFDQSEVPLAIAESIAGTKVYCDGCKEYFMILCEPLPKPVTIPMHLVKPKK